MDDDTEDLRQHIADLAELTVLMRRRANLARYTREWSEDRDVEERLIARIEQWAQASGEKPRTDDPDRDSASRQRERFAAENATEEAADTGRPPSVTKA